MTPISPKLLPILLLLGSNLFMTQAWYGHLSVLYLAEGDSEPRHRFALIAAGAFFVFRSPTALV